MDAQRALMDKIGYLVSLDEELKRLVDQHELASGGQRQLQDKRLEFARTLIGDELR